MNHASVMPTPASESGRLIGSADDILMRLAGIENQLRIHAYRLLGPVPETAEPTSGNKASLNDEAFVAQLDMRFSSMRSLLMQMEARLETLSRF